MNVAEVDIAVKKLGALDTYRRLSDENVRAEYMQSLMGVELSVFNAAFVQLKVSCKELPPITDLLSACRRRQSKTEPERVPCELCNGTGLVNITEKRPLRGRLPGESDVDYESQKKEYVFSYRCFCQNGRRWSQKILRRDAV